MKGVVMVLLAQIGFWGWFFILLIMLPLICLWIFTLMDIFMRKDLPGWMKAISVIIVIILPLFGMLIYFIVRPDTARELSIDQANYQGGPRAALVADSTERIEKLAQLRDKGDITQEEFDKQKAKLLGD
jgi:type VI protein secretion system component VasK